MDELRKNLAEMHNATMAALNYGKTMVLLRALKAGVVRLEEVEVDGDAWQLVDAPVYEAPLYEPGDEIEARDCA